MPVNALRGRWTHRARSIATLTAVSLKVLARRLAGKPLVREWPIVFEIGTLFWRAQFNRAFALKNIADGRAYFDSLISGTKLRPEVDIVPNKQSAPRGDWFMPRVKTSDITLLYFHGGGYTFYAAITRDFIALLAHWLGVRIFALDYRLTPEHAHPAQLDDGVEAYRFLLREGIDPAQLVIGGDSAGGHLALMVLSRLRDLQLPQPALAIALSPWTDTGQRGASLSENDRYDLIQRDMTRQFSAWLKGNRGLTDADVSPLHQSFENVAPIYLQAGGKEILVDMIRDFAHTVEAQGARVRLDVWAHMNHEFHAYGPDLAESRDALDRLGEALTWVADQAKRETFPSVAHTEVDRFFG
jgi:epsilon-lactone hydrolase